MHAMRYAITLPGDYDMTIIRNRVAKSGHLMDGFQDLLFKAYLISEKAAGALQNSYNPLYVWKGAAGMNKFIFDGYFDNILRDFGWQHIEIGIAASTALTDAFKDSKYLTEETVAINPTTSLKNHKLAKPANWSSITRTNGNKPSSLSIGTNPKPKKRAMKYCTYPCNQENPQT